jgi:hypothetical protein|nr:hypothetical protein [uncultured Flavobacterium sp.]
MTQEDFQANFNIPKETIQLVKSVMKISENELEIKWKSTCLIEKMSDAKFNDGRLKVRLEKKQNVYIGWSYRHQIQKENVH